MKRLLLVRLLVALVTTGVACWFNSLIVALLAGLWLFSFEFWNFMDRRLLLIDRVNDALFNFSKDIDAQKAEITHIKNKIGMR